MSWKRPNIGSRVNREVHARFWERAEVKFLRATRQNENQDGVGDILQEQAVWGWFERAKRDPARLYQKMFGFRAGALGAVYEALGHSMYDWSKNRYVTVAATTAGTSGSWQRLIDCRRCDVRRFA